MVRVLDNGPGIAPEMQAHLFEKYRAGLNGPHGAGPVSYTHLKASGARYHSRLSRRLLLRFVLALVG